MSDFVEQCRQEWKRLGVPDPLAEEMAADLASDLREAEAEGVSADELLGSSVFDPRSFAASWAAERGIIPEPPSRGRARRRPLVLVAFTALAALALIVSALLLLTGQPKMSVVASRTTPPHVLAPPAGSVPPGAGRLVLHTSASTPVEWILLLLAIVALGFAAWLWSSWGRSQPPAVPARERLPKPSYTRRHGLILGREGAFDETESLALDSDAGGGCGARCDAGRRRPRRSTRRHP